MKFFAKLAVLVLLSVPLHAQSAKSASVGVEPSCVTNYAGQRLEFTVAEFVERRFAGNSIDYRFFSPFRVLNEFISEGCDDAQFLSDLPIAINRRLLEVGFSDDDILGISILASNADLFEDPIGQFLDTAIEMYFLGFDEHIRRAINRISALKESNNTKALIGLAILGGITGSEIKSLNYRMKRKYENLYNFYSRVGTFYKIRFNTENDQIILDNNLSNIERLLSEAAHDNLLKAAILGDRAALVLQISGAAVDFDPCHRTNNFDTLTLEDMTRKQFLALSDRMKAFRDLYQLVKDMISSKVEARHGLVVRLAIGLANIASDCIYANENPGPFGINSSSSAIELLHIATAAPFYMGSISSPQIDYSFQIALAVALGIERGFSSSQKFYAAARFMLAGAAEMKEIYADELFEIWLPRYSRKTIIEAQKMLAADGLYKSSIDGIPGRGFRNAIEKLDCDGGVFKNSCLSGKTKEVWAETWARPFLIDPRS